MNPKDWIIVAFCLAFGMSVMVVVITKIYAKQHAAQSSMSVIKEALTPFERDEKDALDKLRKIYGRSK